MKNKLALYFLFCVICFTGCAGNNDPQPAAESTPPAATATATPSAAPTATHVGNDALIVPPPTAAETPAPAAFFTPESEAAVRLLSEAAASAVWQYGDALGWTDIYEMPDTYITKEQLALSRATYERALIVWCWENPIGVADDDAREAFYADVLFPGVSSDDLPEEDAFSGWSMGVNILEKEDAARALIFAASPDGDVGYVVVRFLYEHNGAEHIRFFRVDWVKDAQAADGVFPYRLAGVYPMLQHLMGNIQHDIFGERVLINATAEALAPFGITHGAGRLALRGAWGFDGVVMVQTITDTADGELLTFILVHDDEAQEQVQYLGAADITPAERYVPAKLLTPLEAKNMLVIFYIESEPFYPGELDIWKDDAPWYGFTYNDGEAYRYVWVNAVTTEVSFDDEIEDYTREGE